MSQIDKVPANFFFDELVVPLKHANARKKIQYMRLGSPELSTWETVSSRTSGMERRSASNGAANALLSALAEYWNAQGDSNLFALLPYLVALREELMELRPAGKDAEPQLPDFVYPLF